ncbi:hypothetical protein [Pseudoalteromonas luteoviolacea]|uniref:Uncharacterized protein n=1 Tax=Pseudoalteromonas luteoviolacea S4060-1 TaxID=1365257 RepID=A0A162B5D5_9GAMM|nr:hypothetical protein [Pseudoalteromonas luteoviolacea]KZN66785.1 hypothetical protein N478_18280 [Pseudoalteromonas luteoviolacea S4060-1]
MKIQTKILATTIAALVVAGGYYFYVDNPQPTEALTVQVIAPEAVALEETEVVTQESANIPHEDPQNDSEPLIKVAREDRTEENKLEWRKASPEFREFLDLSSKPLISIEDKDRLTQLMYEPKLIDASRETLLKEVTENELDLVAERKRLDAIEYLSTVLVGKFNSPQIHNAKQLASDVLLNTNTRDEQSEDLRRSLVGDKIELGMALAVYHEEEWAMVKDQLAGMGEKQARLVSHIDELALIKADQLSSNALKLAQRLKNLKEEK